MLTAAFMPTEDHGAYQAIAETIIVSSGGVSVPEMNNLGETTAMPRESSVTVGETHPCWWQQCPAPIT